MKHLRTLMFVLALVCFFTTLQPQAKAIEWDKRTLITFNEPVELPGIVLPPGTYLFRLDGDKSDRNIVRVFNKEETHLYATILAVSDYREEPSEGTIINLSKGPSGSPERVTSWFYPGDTHGEEFIYPKSVELAKAPAPMPQNVEPPPQSAEVHEAPMNEAESAAEEAPMNEAESTAEEVEPTQEAAPPVPDNPEPAQMAMAPAEELPKTASPLPWFLLIGASSLVFSLALRFASKKT